MEGLSCTCVIFVDQQPPNRKTHLQNAGCPLLVVLVILLQLLQFTVGCLDSRLALGVLGWRGEGV